MSFVIVAGIAALVVAIFLLVVRFTGFARDQVHGSQTIQRGSPLPDRAGYAEGVDPVCGMHVADDEGVTLTYEGRSFRFCSPNCRRRFESSPETFLQDEPAASAHGAD